MPAALTKSLSTGTVSLESWKHETQVWVTLNFLDLQYFEVSAVLKSSVLLTQEQSTKQSKELTVRLPCEGQGLKLQTGQTLRVLY